MRRGRPVVRAGTRRRPGGGRRQLRGQQCTQTGVQCARGKGGALAAVAAAGGALYWAACWVCHRGRWLGVLLWHPCCCCCCRCLCRWHTASAAGWREHVCCRASNDGSCGRGIRAKRLPGCVCIC